MLKAKFAIPGMAERYNEILYLLDVYEKHREYFNDNVEIGALYGNFQFCTWDGGRIFHEYKHFTAEEIAALKDIYNNKYHIPMRFIFTNTQITQEDCYDRFNNKVLEICADPLNEIVINSPILEKHIRDYYPEYSIISSTTKCLTNQEEAKNEINKNYKYVCLDYNLNHDYNFLENLTKEERNKIEFLINAICIPKCPHRKQHYDLNSALHLNYGKPYRMLGCNITQNNLDPYIPGASTHLTLEEINNYYLPNGFSNFKLEGRTFKPIHFLGCCIKYLIKPEWQLYVLSDYEVYKNIKDDFFRKNKDNY